MDFENPIVIVALISAVVLTAVLVLTLQNAQKPQEQWITALNERVYKIPPEAKLIFKNTSLEQRVAQLKREGKLLMFVGVHTGGGVHLQYAQDESRKHAYQKIAEYLKTSVSSFKNIIESQIQTGNKEQLSQISLSVYNNIVKVFSQAEVSGAYEFAYWQEIEGSLVRTYCLLVYDPEGFVIYGMQNPELKSGIEQLQKNGVDFFKVLNDVLKQISE